MIIELLSESTADVDRSIKKLLYQDRFRTPEYFWFSPDTLEFAGFRLVGHAYQEIETTPEERLWSQELDLYLGIHCSQLRYFSASGELIPTPGEAANQEKRRADRLAQQLRDLEIEPDMS